MRICLVGAASSIHLVRWVNALCELDYEVHVITQHEVARAMHKKAVIHTFPYFGSLGYLLMVPWAKRVVQRIQPQLLHVHYASGYGLLGRMIRFSPTLLSVWGSDVYIFPYRSRIHRWVFQQNIVAMDHLASTSGHLARETQKLAKNPVSLSITPFGVNTCLYECNRDYKHSSDAVLTIGTVKTLGLIYGTDTLLKAFQHVLELPCLTQQIKERLVLRIVGGGDIRVFEALSQSLGIADRVQFAGPVAHSEVPGELEKLDIYVALSRYESFGVSVLEAQASSLPVLVSDVGGLGELVRHGVTGLTVAPENHVAAAVSLAALLGDAALRESLGKRAASEVRQKYEWEQCVQMMTSLYATITGE